LEANNDIYSLCSDASGNIYAAGGFYDQSFYAYVARYGYPAGINEVSVGTIKFSPNPTNSSFTISSGQSLSNAIIRVLDLTGQILMEKENQSGTSFTLDISEQAAGLYFVEVRQAENVWTGKVVKE